MAPIIELSNETLDFLNPKKYTRRLDLEARPIESPKSIILDYNPKPSDYIFVSGIKSGREKRPDLWVCKYRLGMSSEVEQAGRQLGLTLENTAKEKNRKDYVGNINKEQAVRLNLLLGGRTADVRLAKDFLSLLFLGKAEDGNKRKVKSSELDQIADEITGVRNPWRAEWYEDDFVEGDKGLVLNKHYSLGGEVLVLQYSYKLITCLMEDKTPGIDLGNWLKNSTAQGLPRENVKSGDYGIGIQDLVVLRGSSRFLMMLASIAAGILRARFLGLE